MSNQDINSFPVNMSALSVSNGQGYLNPTFSSSVQPTAFGVTERVINSYRTGSYLSLKKLPNKLSPDEVETSRIANINYNRVVRPEQAFKGAKGGDYFHPLKYQYSDFGKSESLNKLDEEFKNLRIQSFSRKPFRYSSSRLKLKHEDIFEDSNYKHSYIAPSKHLTLNEVVRPDVAKFSNPNRGPFLTKGGYTRNLIGDINILREDMESHVDRIMKRLGEDWGHLRFSVVFTTNDELIVSFDPALIQNTEPLIKYVKIFYLLISLNFISLLDVLCSTPTKPFVLPRSIQVI